MPAITIEMLVGDKAGQRTRYEADVLAFGRDRDQQVFVPSEFASRQHGELRYEDGQWWLHNLSVNGTRVNRKMVRKKPTALNDQDLVRFGRQPVFRIHLSLAGAGTSTEDHDSFDEPDEEPINEKKPANKGKVRLWTALGIYMAAVLVIGGVLATFVNKPQSKDAAVATLTETQITQIIRKLPEVDHVDMERAQRALAEADRYYREPASNFGALFHAHRQYQWALAWSGRTSFDDTETKQRFREVEDRLITTVISWYNASHGKFLDADYPGAIAGFDRLKIIYPDPPSPLYENIQRQLHAARSQTAKRKSRFR